MIEISPAAREAMAMLHADLEVSGLGRYEFHLVDTGGIKSSVIGVPSITRGWPLPSQRRARPMDGRCGGAKGAVRMSLP